MHASLSHDQLSVLVTAAHVSGWAHPLLAIGSVPALGFALQILALGTAIGSAVALCGKLRDPEFDPWPTTTAWATLGLVVGLLIAAIGRIA